MVGRGTVDEKLIVTDDPKFKDCNIQTRFDLCLLLDFKFLIEPLLSWKFIFADLTSIHRKRAYIDKKNKYTRFVYATNSVTIAKTSEVGTFTFKVVIVLKTI